MDPNAALGAMRRLSADILADWPEDDDNVTPAIELAEAFQGLDEWLSAGGFRPDAWGSR